MGVGPGGRSRVLTFFPVRNRYSELVGIGYSLRTGTEPSSFVVPALIGQLQVVLTGSLSRVRGAGATVQPAVAIVGPTSCASSLVVAPGSWLIGYGLVPTGWSRTARVPAHQLLDEVVDAADVWGARRVRALVDGVADGDDEAVAVRRLADRLVRPVRDEPSPSDGRLIQTEGWIAGGRASSLQALAARLELSPRQTARLTAAHFGCSPKLLQMKYHALALSVALSLGRAEADDPPPAATELYFDQSHLISDFRRFVGSTPARFQREQALFSRTLLTGRWNAGARSPTTLWS